MSEPLTITDAAKLIKSGELTPSELLEQCLRRVDIYEHAVKAWVYLDRERARQEAAKFTDEIKKGHYRGPLHGIPIGIKDIIDVYDMPTGCGSKLWANSYARRDATCVSRLRDAGAVIMGKTVTTPYAYLDPPVTRNPWNLDCTPGGSSSGSAAAVACAMCLGALGTQTGGSLTRPASYCGVCSLKPTYGRVSVAGVLPLAPNLDHVGVIAGCVWDLAVMFEVISGTDGESGVAQAIPDAINRIDCRLSPTCQEPPPKFTRLRGLFVDRAEPAMLTAIDRLSVDLKSLSSTQCRVLDAVPPAGFSDLARFHRTIMSVEAATYHGSRFERHPEDYPPRIRELILDGLSCSAVLYRQARLDRDSQEIEIEGPAVWGGIYLTPASTGPAPDTKTTGDAVFNIPWSYTNLPTVSIPILRNGDGLPMAVQLAGSTEHDGWLLASAAWVEREFGLARDLPPIPQPG